VLLLHFGHAATDATIADVVLEPTDLPLDPGSAVGGPAPRPDGPGGPGGGDGSGTTFGAPGDPSQDGSGSPSGGTTASGTAGGTAGATSVPGNGAPSPEACSPAAYSSELDLCYDRTTGYVWDVSVGDWALPPPVEWCGVDEANPGRYYHFWPLVSACYSPTSGYAWNEQQGEWVFVGRNLVRAVLTDDGPGCSLHAGTRPLGSGSEGRAGWALLLLTALGCCWRRRGSVRAR
jgi:hypothetical protein